MSTTGHQASLDPGTLVARTVEVDDPPDFLAIGSRPDGVLWQQDGITLAGAGTALRLSLPSGLSGRTDHVADALKAIPADGVEGPGRGPLAIGALPFDPDEPGELVVPRILAGRDSKGAWLTTIGDADAPTPELTAPAKGEPPDEFTLTPEATRSQWRQTIRDAVQRIDAGELSKVVLARRIDIVGNRPFVVADVLSRLEALYPTCTVFHIDGFIGASPELLVERTAGEVRSQPLAGTVARSGDDDSDQRLMDSLMDSAKERAEHGFVIDALTSALRPVCTTVDTPDRPVVISLRNVSHLATPVRGTLARPYPSALDLVGRLHPTPAVGGVPDTTALAHIRAAESFDRGHYAGPVGWMDAQGDGAWMVGIRSAEVDGSRARIYAGVGVVHGSTPADELTETQLKLQALLAALVRP